jgi:hypothetical protein
LVFALETATALIERSAPEIPVAELRRRLARAAAKATELPLIRVVPSEPASIKSPEASVGKVVATEERMQRRRV